jgi:hypothetical protein
MDITLKKTVDDKYSERYSDERQNKIEIVILELENMLLNKIIADVVNESFEDHSGKTSADAYQDA